MLALRGIMSLFALQQGQVMLDALLSFTRDVADPIGIWVGLAIAVPIVWTWYDLVWGRRRRVRRWLAEVRGTPGHRPAVLLVDLLSQRDVGVAVRHFMAGHDTLQTVPEERIVTVTRNRDLRPEDMPALAGELRRASARVLTMGADELWVFLAGPLAAAAVVGAELANIGCRVHVLQNDRATQGYVDFGPLHYPGL